MNSANEGFAAATAQIGVGRTDRREAAAEFFLVYIYKAEEQIWCLRVCVCVCVCVRDSVCNAGFFHKYATHLHQTLQSCGSCVPPEELGNGKFVTSTVRELHPILYPKKRPAGK